MSIDDEVLQFDCEQASLLGILSAAREDAALGVVVVVGGPQYRIGSHRQFVQLARRLAAGGVPCLRFDHRGMGDSTGEPRSFDELGADIDAAISALMARLPGLRGVVLWGLCDGASAALLYHQQRQDVRVKGLVLLNPWVRSEATLARAQVKHYYRQRLLQSAFWAKLLRGGLSRKSWTDLFSNARNALGASRAMAGDSFQNQMAQAWRSFEGHILLIISEQDVTAQEFLEAAASQDAWAGALRKPRLTQLHIAGADHTFSAPSQQRQVSTATLEWLNGVDDGLTR